MIYTFEQIQDIIFKNPNKDRITYGRERANKLMLHLHGKGMESAIKHCDYFASKDLHAVQKEYAVSNKDLFGRLLQQEDMVFTESTGSSNYYLPEKREEEMRALVADVNYGMDLRKWVQSFALQAYRSDPMGVLFMEEERLEVGPDGALSKPKVYPTYKSIYSIHDYKSKGRKLEYVCFRLTVGEAIDFGIVDDELNGPTSVSKESSFYRFVDDVKDLIVKKNSDSISLVTKINQPNPIPNPWKRTPAFIISDLIKFNDPNCFGSPLDLVVELADCFLFDRSVRDLQKKYHGFAKPVEPLLQCPTCVGEGFVTGSACPDCTPAGAQKGTGFKMRTKVSEAIKFPLSILEEVPGFDFKRVLGYATPDIAGWEKQDSSLEDLEQLMEMTYWGTVRMRRPKPGKDAGNGEAITATESDSNEKPKLARLNQTADWAQSTENLIAEFIGQYSFESFKKVAIIYGRDYVLKTAEQLLAIYHDMRTKGAPDFLLDQALEKYLKAAHQDNPTQMEKCLKMLDVEPFPHIAIAQAKGIITDFNDYNCKLYFGEWSNTIPDIMWLQKKAPELRELLKVYVEGKGLKEPLPDPKQKPAFA